MHELYKKQVALLIRIMPSVYRIQDFAVHGGTAINLFHKDMPRYSVDVDITYIPVQNRDESLKAIKAHLVELKQRNLIWDAQLGLFHLHSCMVERFRQR